MVGVVGGGNIVGLMTMKPKHPLAERSRSQKLSRLSALTVIGLKHW